MSKCRRILIVEDGRAARRMLALLLKALGDHEIETADDGPAALERLRDFRPDIALLDISLPGMNGYELATAIRSRHEFDDTLLVALTGYGQDEDRRRSSEAGFDEHRVKPVSVADLEELLAHPRLAPPHPRAL